MHVKAMPFLKEPVTSYPLDDSEALENNVALRAGASVRFLLDNPIVSQSIGLKSACVIVDCEHAD
jgi:hypothetical protein